MTVILFQWSCPVLLLTPSSTPPPSFFYSPLPGVRNSISRVTQTGIGKERGKNTVIRRKGEKENPRHAKSQPPSPFLLLITPNDLQFFSQEAQLPISSFFSHITLSTNLAASDPGDPFHWHCPAQPTLAKAPTSAESSSKKRGRPVQ